MCGLTLGRSTAFFAPFDVRISFHKALESVAVGRIRNVGKSVHVDEVAAAINAVAVDVAMVVAELLVPT